mmetsp:Transcript_20653/g.57028  ORF Transcript_20653/g.57028 Transcript_20653/m.57028 type:complete len:283 (+) Transcript_20653:1430-2278(+)
MNESPGASNTLRTLRTPTIGPPCVDQEAPMPHTQPQQDRVVVSMPSVIWLLRLLLPKHEVLSDATYTNGQMWLNVQACTGAISCILQRTRDARLHTRSHSGVACKRPVQPTDGTMHRYRPCAARHYTDWEMPSRGVSHQCCWQQLGCMAPSSPWRMPAPLWPATSNCAQRPAPLLPPALPPSLQPPSVGQGHTRAALASWHQELRAPLFGLSRPQACQPAAVALPRHTLPERTRAGHRGCPASKQWARPLSGHADRLRTPPQTQLCVGLCAVANPRLCFAAL